MNDQRIQQVLDIEKQAQAVHDSALAQADQLPKQAEKEAQTIIEQARAAAEQEAQQMIANANPEDESQRILMQAEADARNTESLAMTNFERAVSYVLNRVVGKE